MVEIEIKQNARLVFLIVQFRIKSKKSRIFVTLKLKLSELIFAITQRLAVKYILLYCMNESVCTLHESIFVWFELLRS